MAYTCRICLDNESNSNWIFDPNKNEEFAEKLDVMIFMSTGVTVLETDEITQYLCEKCTNLIVNIFKFRALAIRNNDILKARNEMKKVDNNKYIKAFNKPIYKPINKPISIPNIYLRTILRQYPNLKFPTNMNFLVNYNPSVTVYTDEVSNYFLNDFIINTTISNNTRNIMKCVNSILDKTEENRKILKYGHLIITPIKQKNLNIIECENSNNSLENTIVPNQGTNIKDISSLKKTTESDVIKKSNSKINIIENYVIDVSYNSNQNKTLDLENINPEKQNLSSNDKSDVLEINKNDSLVKETVLETNKNDSEIDLQSTIDQLTDIHAICNNEQLNDELCSINNNKQEPDNNSSSLELGFSKEEMNLNTKKPLAKRRQSVCLEQTLSTDSDTNCTQNETLLVKETELESNKNDTEIDLQSAIDELVDIDEICGDEQVNDELCKEQEPNDNTKSLNLEEEETNLDTKKSQPKRRQSVYSLRRHSTDSAQISDTVNEELCNKEEPGDSSKPLDLEEETNLDTKKSLLNRRKSADSDTTSAQTPDIVNEELCNKQKPGGNSKPLDLEEETNLDTKKSLLNRRKSADSDTTSAQTPEIVNEELCNKQKPGGNSKPLGLEEETNLDTKKSLPRRRQSMYNLRRQSTDSDTTSAQSPDIVNEELCNKQEPDGNSKPLELEEEETNLDTKKSLPRRRQSMYNLRRQSTDSDTTSAQSPDIVNEELCKKQEPDGNSKPLELEKEETNLDTKKSLPKRRQSMYNLRRQSTDSDTTSAQSPDIVNEELCKKQEPDGNSKPLELEKEETNLDTKKSLPKRRQSMYNLRRQSTDSDTTSAQSASIVNEELCNKEQPGDNSKSLELEEQTNVDTKKSLPKRRQSMYNLRRQSTDSDTNSVQQTLSTVNKDESLMNETRELENNENATETNLQSTIDDDVVSNTEHLNKTEEVCNNKQEPNDNSKSLELEEQTNLDTKKSLPKRRQSVYALRRQSTDSDVSCKQTSSTVRDESLIKETLELENNKNETKRDLQSTIDELSNIDVMCEQLNKNEELCNKRKRDDLSKEEEEENNTEETILDEKKQIAKRRRSVYALRRQSTDSDTNCTQQTSNSVDDVPMETDKEVVEVTNSNLDIREEGLNSQKDTAKETENVETVKKSEVIERPLRRTRSKSVYQDRVPNKEEDVLDMLENLLKGTEETSQKPEQEVQETISTPKKIVLTLNKEVNKESIQEFEEVWQICSKKVPDEILSKETSPILDEEFIKNLTEIENEETVVEKSNVELASTSSLKIVTELNKETNEEEEEEEEEETEEQTGIKRKLETNDNDDNSQNKYLCSANKDDFVKSLDLAPVTMDDLTVLSKVSKCYKLYTCKICNSVHSSSRELRNHERKQHSRCKFCKIKFNNSLHLINHIKDCARSLKPIIRLPRVDSIKLIREKYANAFKIDENLLNESFEEEKKEQLLNDMRLNKIENNEFVFELNKATTSLTENLSTNIENTSTEIVYISDDDTQNENITTEPIVQNQNSDNNEDIETDSQSEVLTTEQVIDEDLTIINDQITMDLTNYRPITHLKCAENNNLLKGLDFNTTNLVIVKEVIDIIRNREILAKNETFSFNNFESTNGESSKTKVLKGLRPELYAYKILTQIEHGEELNVSYMLKCKSDTPIEKNLWNNTTPIDIVNNNVLLNYKAIQPKKDLTKTETYVIHPSNNTTSATTSTSNCNLPMQVSNPNSNYLLHLLDMTDQVNKNLTNSNTIQNETQQQQPSTSNTQLPVVCISPTKTQILPTNKVTKTSKNEAKIQPSASVSQVSTVANLQPTNYILVPVESSSNAQNKKVYSRMKIVNKFVSPGRTNVNFKNCGSKSRSTSQTVSSSSSSNSSKIGSTSNFIHLSNVRNAPITYPSAAGNTNLLAASSTKKAVSTSTVTICSPPTNVGTTSKFDSLNSTFMLNSTVANPSVSATAQIISTKSPLTSTQTVSTTIAPTFSTSRGIATLVRGNFATTAADSSSTTTTRAICTSTPVISSSVRPSSATAKTTSTSKTLANCPVIRRAVYPTSTPAVSSSVRGVNSVNAATSSSKATVTSSTTTATSSPKSTTNLRNIRILSSSAPTVSSSVRAVVGTSSTPMTTRTIASSARRSLTPAVSTSQSTSSFRSNTNSSSNSRAAIRVREIWELNTHRFNPK